MTVKRMTTNDSSPASLCHDGKDWKKKHLKMMKSRVADLKNVGGPHAGGSTAAAFLAEFAGETPWVHLDIAGSGMTSQSSAYHRGGGTGVGVRTLLEWIQARSQRGQKSRRTKRR